MLDLIKCNFIYMDRNTFVLLYKSLVRPHLAYAKVIVHDSAIFTRDSYRLLQTVLINVKLL